MAMDQAHDFLRECQAIEALVEPLSETDYARATGFKGWTINQILRHLHVWNHAAQLSLTDEAGFRAWMDDATQSIGGGNMPDFEKNWLDGASGRALFDIWRETYPAVAEKFCRSRSFSARTLGRTEHERAILDHRAVDGKLGAQPGDL